MRRLMLQSIHMPDNVFESSYTIVGLREASHRILRVVPPAEARPWLQARKGHPQAPEEHAPSGQDLPEEHPDEGKQWEGEAAASGGRTNAKERALWFRSTPHSSPAAASHVVCSCTSSIVVACKIRCSFPSDIEEFGVVGKILTVRHRRGWGRPARPSGGRWRGDGTVRAVGGTGATSAMKEAETEPMRRRQMQT
jgi:hypothetical protein